MQLVKFEDIVNEALRLSPEARARLAEELLASLETQSDEENDRLWAAEALARDSDWEAGRETGGDLDSVLRRLLSRFA